MVIAAAEGWRFVLSITERKRFPQTLTDFTFGSTRGWIQHVSVVRWTRDRLRTPLGKIVLPEWRSAFLFFYSAFVIHFMSFGTLLEDYQLLCSYLFVYFCLFKVVLISSSSVFGSRIFIEKRHDQYLTNPNVTWSLSHTSPCSAPCATQCSDLHTHSS